MRNFFQDESKTALELFNLAWDKLLRWQPFYGSQMFALKVIESVDFPTMATDGSKLYFNPDYLRESTEKHRLEVEFHEVLHVVLKHHIVAAMLEKKLGERYDHERFNRAGDYEANWILKICGCDIEGGLYEQRFNGKEVTEIYFILEAEESQQNTQRQQQQNGSNQPGNEQGNESDSGSDSSDDSGPDCDANGDSGQDGKSDDISDDNSDNSGPVSSGNGGVSDTGNDNNATVKDTFKGDHGQVLIPRNDEGEKLNESELETLEKELEGRLLNAAKMAEKQGHPCPMVDEIIDRFTETKVDWNDHLQSFLTEKFLSHKSWSRSNRRWRQHGMYMPGKLRENRGRLAFLRDVSGSVDRDKKQAFGDAINECIMTLDTELDIMVIDFHHGIHNHYETCSEDAPLTFNNACSGGTNYQPVFELLSQSGFDPDAIVVLTDLECYRFPSDPGIPTLWAFAGYGEHEDYDVPFGEIVVM